MYFSYWSDLHDHYEETVIFEKINDRDELLTLNPNPSYKEDNGDLILHIKEVSSRSWRDRRDDHIESYYIIYYEGELLDTDYIRERSNAPCCRMRNRPINKPKYTPLSRKYRKTLNLKK